MTLAGRHDLGQVQSSQVGVEPPNERPPLAALFGSRAVESVGRGEGFPAEFLADAVAEALFKFACH